MCEQTEINYLDGDIVWVKLGACWWPGQVTSFHNLPDDIQVEFKKKPLIAAVKFFQEDTFEFVRNLQQIYKYNCTQKDEFIRKGLDKHRTKSKDGKSYMDKFPGDVEMAEKLTGGDPDILLSEKFIREEKPDISALFGEKKVPKRKRDEMARRSEGNEVTRKITHPRFIRESDHEIRIRQQPSSLSNTPKTPNSDSPQFSCHLCNFTSTRVNVIICHRKSHCSGGMQSPLARPRIISNSQSAKSSGRPSLPETQKRKYVRKTKSFSTTKSSKIDRESNDQPVKRKLSKQIEKPTTKKKKTDPELREQLLADWDDESDDEEDMKKLPDVISLDSSPSKNSVDGVSMTPEDSADDKNNKDDDRAEIIEASEKLLRETENLTSLLDDPATRNSRQSNNSKNGENSSMDVVETSSTSLPKEEKTPTYKKPKKLIASSEERKSSSSDKDDKQSRFSCFDFDEEDPPEPTITPVRKIPRVFGEKNTSVKKEILKKFTMSQALQSEKEKEESNQDFRGTKEPTAKEKKKKDNSTEDEGNTDYPLAKEVEKPVELLMEETKVTRGTGETLEKPSKEQVTVTEVEIVEIVEVEGEKDEENDEIMKKSINYELECDWQDSADDKSDRKSTDETFRSSKAKKNAGRRGKRHEKDVKISEEIVTTEPEDEDNLAASESKSEIFRIDGDRGLWDNPSSAPKVESARDDAAAETPQPRRRGRPRKHPVVEHIEKKIAAADSEPKTSESDSERSHSGRTRKPNKRYLHSQIYTSSPDNRSSKTTDESQSESEEKIPAVEKVKSRRGRKKKVSTCVDSGKSDVSENTAEFEFSNKTLVASREEPMDEADTRPKFDEEPPKIRESEPEKLEDVEGKGESANVMEVTEKFERQIGSPVNITKFLSSNNSEGHAANISQDEKMEKPSKAISETVEEPEMPMIEDSKIDTKFDKLPPKKSQIKKFELSQIDLLDACAEQVAAEQAAAEKAAAEKLEAERLAAAKLEAERLAAEKIEAERLAAEQLEAERLAAAEKAEAERLAAEEKAEAERLAAEEKAEAERLAAEEKAEAERLAAEKLEAERLAAEKLEAERLAAAEKAEAERLAAEKAEAERLAAEKLAEEKLAAEKLAAEKLAEEERLAAEKLAEEERLAAEKLAEEETLAAEKLAEDERLAAEKLAEEERLAAEKLAEEERLAAEKLAEEERLAAEKLAEEERLAAEKLAEEERLAAEKLAEEERLEAEKKLAAEKLAAEEAEEKLKADEKEGAKIAEKISSEVQKPDKSDDSEPKVQSIEQEITERIQIPEASTVVATDEKITIISDSANVEGLKDSTMETIEAVLARITNESPSITEPAVPSPKTLEKTAISDHSKIPSSPGPTKENLQIPKRSTSIQTRYKGKFTPETGAKTKKEVVVDEEIPLNSFQEAFLKTLHDDKNSESTSTSVKSTPAKTSKESEKMSKNAPEQTLIISLGNNETLVPMANVQQSQNVQPLNAMTEFEGVEILVQESLPEKIEGSTTVNQMDLAADGNALSLDLKKIQDTLSDNASIPSPSSDISMPVKKREKPRIIENVELKEPMQILKTKLLEKMPGKSAKHKLDSETAKKGGSDGKGGSRAKIMKMESGSSPSSGKPKIQAKTSPAHFTMTRKLQIVKTGDEAIEETEKLPPASMTLPKSGEKIIQQSSQSLADMELDINSMPFVLSEDVLTPESIENMPVVITSIMPSSSSSAVPTTLTLTPATPHLVPTTPETTYKVTECPMSNEATGSGKKKSGTPAILKNKAKAKPTITSIKTLVPPFTGGGVKSLKFGSQQANVGGKVVPLMSSKSGTPGKYVIVQTAGGQHMRYSVQGKPGSTQKIAIPAGKATGSAQIVSQGGKVVILTSAPSGQTKMLPLSISKSMSGKVQKIVNNKGQIYTMSSQTAGMGQKTIIAPKTDACSPTTSKMCQGQKGLPQGSIITSKSVLTTMPTSKANLLSTLSQSIITKGGIYTPISSGTHVTGKGLMTGKALGNKTATILSSIGAQTIAASKGTILAPMSHAMGGKTIVNAQGIVSPKGTVLTPITGQQVKAIAAKNPGKAAASSTSGKVQYQTTPQKMQMPMLQKCQKMPASTGSQLKAATSTKSPSGSTFVFQNTPGSHKITASPSGKKIVRQVAHQVARSPQATVAQVQTQQTQTTVSPQLLQRAKSMTTTPTTVQRMTPRLNTGRQSKAHQKIVVQKLAQDASMTMGELCSTVTPNIHTKTIIGESAADGSSQKTFVQTPKSSRTPKSPRNSQKVLQSPINPISTAGSQPIVHSMATQAQIVQQQISTPQATSSALPTSSVGTQSSLQNLTPTIPTSEMPILEETPGKTDKIADSLSAESFKQEVPKSVAPTILEQGKIEATKVPPQIMALPTESSDGTQTYVLVTIDEQGQIQPLDNNTLMSLEGTTQNADGTRTLYIDPSSLGDGGTLDNIVLQFDNGAVSNAQTSIGETPSHGIVSTDTFPTSEIIQTANQDILAAALANTDFQQEICLPENVSSSSTSSVMSAGLTQTSLINQTILQSTIIPPTEPISSPSVLETSLTLNQPIMTPLEVPSSLPIQVAAATRPPSVISTIPTSLELPITITNPNISYITSASTESGEQHIQIPGNSMPDIGEIMETTSVIAEGVQPEVPTSTQYLVLPALDEMQSREIESEESVAAVPPVTYSVSIPENMVISDSPGQTTPSMPIIDDGYVESTEQRFTDSPIMLVARDEPSVGQEITESTVQSAETQPEVFDNSATTYVQVDTSNEIPVGEQKIVEQSVEGSEQIDDEHSKMLVDEQQNVDIIAAQTVEIPPETTSKDVEPITPEDRPTTENFPEIPTTNTQPEAEIPPEMASNEASYLQEGHPLEEEIPSVQLENCTIHEQEEAPTASMETVCESMVVEETVEMEIYPGETGEVVTDGGETSSRSEGTSSRVENAESAIDVEAPSETIIETSQEESPSQSYEQFEISGRLATSDSPEIPTQSAGKSEISEPSQSAYESMETDEAAGISRLEPPTQSFEDSKRTSSTTTSSTSQSYETNRSPVEISTNAPTQSFNELMEEDEPEVGGGSSSSAIVAVGDDGETDDPSFPTQSYEVGKPDNISEVSDEAAITIGQEGGNIPSQSNDIGTDGIGTSSVTTNNAGLNEDETASSSYVPETPENQERDQDQESAISTSSYEIPPCEELNIASSSVIPDTSVHAGEHMSIHDNGVPEIPTSSYNLNPDSSSTSQGLPTSSYEDQERIVEQNVSTSYEVPMPPGLQENSPQNFVTESTATTAPDHHHHHRGNEPTSYYARHPEVSASYYETVNQDSNSRLEADPQEEVTPSYYEQAQDIGSEASQSYFRSANQRYSGENASPSYYDPSAETEASQSNYYSHEIHEATEQSSSSSSRNVEASQSFYQETNDEMRLRQQGEATPPTYTERYPVDYALENSPIDRHDLVESSVPATRPTER